VLPEKSFCWNFKMAADCQCCYPGTDSAILTKFNTHKQKITFALGVTTTFVLLKIQDGG
jgi:hypothetical protein